MSLQQQSTEPGSAGEQNGNRQRPQRHGKPARGKNQRPTHFLCFPLTTDESVRQLGQSLAYFRSITAPLPQPDPEATPEPEELQEPNSRAQTLRGGGQNEQDDSKLRLLPGAAHRAPGTFHLTLGTMDLSKPEDMEKALTLLQEIDYTALLKATESGGSIIEHMKRRNARKQAHMNKSEGLPNAPEESAGPIPEKKDSTETSLAPQNVNDASSRTTTPKPAPAPAEAKKMSSSTDPDSLKSLTRPISPPPASSHLSQPTHQSSAAVAAAAEKAALTTTLHSLDVFPNPRSARVFFAHPDDPSTRLLTFGNMIRWEFRDAGLITETRPLVLHATVANMIYVKGRKGGAKGAKAAKGDGDTRSRSGRGKGGDGTVDAREILAFFNGGTDKAMPMTGQDTAEPDSETPTPDPAATPSAAPFQQTVRPYVWASDIPISRIRLCKMGAEKCDTPGWGMEYKAIAEKTF